MNDFVTITEELIESGKSPKGGWSKAQLAILGAPWPPQPGWKLRAIGATILRKDAERFTALRNGNPKPN